MENFELHDDYEARLKLETEMINILREHYQTCKGKQTPLKALKMQFGNGFNFNKLGLGKFSVWIKDNSHTFQVEKIANNFFTDIDIQNITENDLIYTITNYFNQSNPSPHRKYLANYLRKIYGEGEFSRFGFGTLNDFLIRHNI